MGVGCGAGSPAAAGTWLRRRHSQSRPSKSPLKVAFQVAHQCQTLYSTPTRWHGRPLACLQSCGQLLQFSVACGQAGCSVSC